MAARRLATALSAITLLVMAVGCEEREPVRYWEPVFDEVDVEADVIYRQTVDWQGAEIDLRLDLYQPAGDTAGERPAVMWMFGGHFVGGHRDDMQPYAEDSARRGYVGVSIQYRTRPGMSRDDVPGVVEAAYDAYDDAVAAVEWLKTNAGRYRIDPDAIVAAGYSAGGFTALHLGYLAGLRPPDSSPVAGIVAIGANSFALPDGDDPPAIMFHGNLDDVVPVDDAAATCEAGRAVGTGCDWIPFAGEDHTIVSTRADDIRSITAVFLVRRVLEPLGYDFDS